MTKIYIMSGPAEGEFFDMEGDTVHIGRSPQNHIQIKDKYVSRRHLQITQKKGRYIIKDLNSKNGTFVNGEAIDPGVDVVVAAGLPIVIGMSLICLGKECSESVLEFLGSFEGEKADEGETVHQEEDRPMTSAKNKELIQKVSDVFMESSDVNEIMEKILEYLLEVLKRVDRTFILLFDNQTEEVTHIATRVRREEKGKKIHYSQSVVDQVRKDGKALIVSDVNGADRPDFTMTLDLEQIKSVMCVPLLFRSQIRGVIYVDSLSRSNGFRKEDLSLLTTISSRAALSIHSALVVSSQEEEL